MSVHWQYLASGLGLRDDEFSWQGSFRDDPSFFLRRDKDRLNRITDLQIGKASEEVAAQLLADFLECTGGLVAGKPLIFPTLARIQEEHPIVIKVFDQTVRISERALSKLGFEGITAKLNDDLGYWSAIFETDSK